MKIYISIALIAAISGAALTKHYWPTQVTTTKEIEVVKTNVVTEVREVVRVDGTKETVTIIKDTSTKKSTDTTVAIAAPPKPLWNVSLSATRSSNELLHGKLIYGVQATYNLLGPFSLGARVDTEKQIGLVLGMEF